MPDAQREIELQQQKDRSQVKSDAELFQGLIKHPGWPRYIALIEAVSQNYYKKVMQPVENVMLCTTTEHAKGALTGLSLAAQLPSAKIREAEELRRPSEDDEEHD